MKGVDYILWGGVAKHEFYTYIFDIKKPCTLRINPLLFTVISVTVQPTSIYSKSFPKSRTLKTFKSSSAINKKNWETNG